MTMNIRATTATAMAQELINDITDGVGDGYFQFYEGILPTGPDDPIGGQTLLGILQCSATEATLAGSTITFNTIAEEDAALASGTAEFARYYNGDNVAIADFDVTDNLGDGAIKMNTTVINIGGPIGISSFVIAI